MSQVIVRSVRTVATLMIALGLLTWCEAQQTVEYAELRNAKALSGFVSDETGSAVPDVRVTEASCDWKAPVRSTTTDAQGEWSLYPYVNGKTYCIEFVKPNFNPVRIRVKMTTQGSDKIVVKLPVAT